MSENERVFQFTNECRDEIDNLFIALPNVLRS